MIGSEEVMATEMEDSILLKCKISGKEWAITSEKITVQEEITEEEAEVDHQ
jgi:hypothetical protein